MSSPRYSLPQQNWRKLYLEAIFESDRAKLSFRISVAEKALLRREQQLFKHRDIRERDAVNAALTSLGALKRCSATAA